MYNSTPIHHFTCILCIFQMKLHICFINYNYYILTDWIHSFPSPHFYLRTFHTSLRFFVSETFSRLNFLLQFESLLRALICLQSLRISSLPPPLPLFPLPHSLFRVTWSLSLHSSSSQTVHSSIHLSPLFSFPSDSSPSPSHSSSLFSTFFLSFCITFWFGFVHLLFFFLFFISSFYSSSFSSLQSFLITTWSQLLFPTCHLSYSIIFSLNISLLISSLLTFLLPSSFFS